MLQEERGRCIDTCDACAAACDHCAASCLGEKDVKAMARCIQLDMDCAAICRLASSYLARDSELAGMICETCAEVCDECARECERHGMEHCKQCAAACRRCAEECRRMASGHLASAQSGRPAAHH